jgi:hypothetical protein
MQYVATVERHSGKGKSGRRGMPHLNVIIACEGMAEDLRTMPAFVRQWVKDHAAYCGFGPVGAFVDVARSRADVAGYVVKLADKSSVGEVAGETVGEVVKLSQMPRNAPKGFRRLRSSKGFLPDVKPESEYTGELERWPHPEAMNAEQKERWRGHLEALERQEQELGVREQLRRERGLPEVPHPWRGDGDGRAWDRHKAPPLERIVLDIGPPPEGDEYF